MEWMEINLSSLKFLCRHDPESVSQIHNVFLIEKYENK